METVLGKWTAVIADDEPLLREELTLMLQQAWPELSIVAYAKNGREAVKLFEQHQPQLCFLDVHMPGLNGIEAARIIGNRAHLVFVTAFDHYALDAFAQGAHDYLVKPVAPTRLVETVTRLKERLSRSQDLPRIDDLLDLLAKAKDGKSSSKGAPQFLRWIRANIGQTLRMIAVEDIDFFLADDKYVVITWRDEHGKVAEALIRTPLRELLPQLDPTFFSQVHRSTVVNMSAISHVIRGDNETASIHFKGHDKVAPVSRNYLHLFRQM